MKIRFAVTLLAVAIAVIGVKANAAAPVIGFVPDVTIADDANPATADQPFVYPDAIDVTRLAVDPNNTVTTQTMVWSYFTQTTAARYRLNDRDSLILDPANPAVDDPNVPGVKALTAGDDPQSVDNNVRTITFRDSTLSPVGGTTNHSGSATNGLVTLIASDGDQFTSNTFFVYTAPGGADALTNFGATTNTKLLEVEYDHAPAAQTGTAAWLSSTWNSASAISGTNGLCLAVTPAGENMALWVGPSKMVDLLKNNVYRIRLTMNNGGVYVPTYHFPFWDLVIDNYESTFTNGSGKYFGDFMVWDVNGGAETLGNNTGRSTFDVWWAPMPLLAADWNSATGEFTAAKDPTNDIRIYLRVLDTTTGAIDGANDYGTICLSNVKVDRVSFDALVKVGDVYKQENLTASTMAIGSIFPRQIAGGAVTGSARTLVTWADGDVTLQPYLAGPFTTGSWNAEVINVDSGDSNMNISVPSSLPDNFPFKWNSDRLLMGTITVQAPDTQAEVNPPDALVMIFDEPTNELLQNSAIVCSNNTLGFPKVAASTDLVSFLYTNAKTKSVQVNADSIRLRLLIINSPTMVSGGTTSNLGGITVKSFKVTEYVTPSLEN